MNKTSAPEPTVFVVDDDDAMRDALSQLLQGVGMAVEVYPSGAEFLVAYTEQRPGCLLLDIAMPGMSGLEVQQALKERKLWIPIIFLTGHGDIPMAVKSIQEGAVDFLEKPMDTMRLIACLHKALELDKAHEKERMKFEKSFACLNTLTPREMEILRVAITGASNKAIAQQLGISHRTVEIHRSHILLKTGKTSMLELAELVGALSQRQARISDH